MGWKLSKPKLPIHPSWPANSAATSRSAITKLSNRYLPSRPLQSLELKQILSSRDVQVCAQHSKHRRCSQRNLRRSEQGQLAATDQDQAWPAVERTNCKFYSSESARQRHLDCCVFHWNALRGRPREFGSLRLETLGQKHNVGALIR